MPVTSGDLKTAVAGFMHRKEADFLANGTFDVLLRAMNNARVETERLIDFELSSVAVDLLNTSVKDGVDLSNAKLHDTNELVKVKKIQKAFLGYKASTASFPIGFSSKQKWIERLQRKHESTVPTDRQIQNVTSSPFVLVQQGTRVFIAPADTSTVGGDTVNIYLDVLRFLPDYIIGTEQDFLLDNCFDWMIYRTVNELNFYLKEDERVPLSDTLVQRSWDSVVKWNTNMIIQAVDDTTLD